MEMHHFSHCIPKQTPNRPKFKCKKKPQFIEILGDKKSREKINFFKAMGMSEGFIGFYSKSRNTKKGSINMTA